MQAVRNKIAPLSIFVMLYISNIVVCLTNAQSFTTGLVIKTDILISIIASMALSLVLALPAIYCYKKNKNPFDIKWISVLYGIYFIYIAAVNISRFAYFSSSTFNPASQAWPLCVLISVSALYCACLGIESLARFSSFAFISLLVAILIIILCSTKNYHEINLYPVIQNDAKGMLRNIAVMTSQTSEIALFLCLCKRTNGDCIKPFVWSLIASYVTVFVLFLFVVAIMGASASMQSFPIFTMFQMAKFSSFERIDVIHISFWVFGIFIKSVLLIYCSSICIKSFKSKTKCAVSALLAMVVSIVITEFFKSANMMPISIVICFCIFCVVIPTGVLIFKKRNYGDELIEKF